jgi:MFS family permease
VNAYTVPFALLLLPGVALADRYGRRRLFVLGLTVFTAGSVAAALSTSIETLIAARAIQGAGGGIVTPLTLTLLSAAMSPERRGLALGFWGAISGLAVALGPLVGGAIVEGWSWQWVFWLNVPIGVAAVALAVARIDQSTGPSRSLDLPGLGLACVGLLGIVSALMQGNELGWGAPGWPAHWSSGWQHELMLPAMVIPMLFRLDVYTGRGSHTARAPAAAHGRVGHHTARPAIK